ncbi:MAG: methyl-accepting chemotaxis protein [Lachnospira sp.]
MEKNEQKLSTLSDVVSKRTSKSVKRIIMATSLIATILVIVILLINANSTCKEKARIYTAQVETAMSEKISFIETIAAGVNSGVVNKDAYYDYVNEMVEQYDDVSAVYVCVPDSSSKYKDGIYTYMSGGWVPPADFVVSERSWYKGALENKGLFVSDPYVDEQSGDICITLSYMVETSGGKGAVGMDMYMSDLMSLSDTADDGGNYICITSNDGTILTHPDADYALSTTNNVNVSSTRYSSAFNNDGKVYPLFEMNGGLKAVCSIKSESLNWSVIYVKSELNVILIIAVLVIAITLVTIVSAQLNSKRLLRSIAPMFKPLENVSSNISNITDGNLDFSFEVDQQSLEINEVTQALNSTIDGLRYYIHEISEVVDAIANKNLSLEITGNYNGDYKKIKNSLERIIQVLNSSFASINEQAGTVRSFSDDLAQTSENVAESATVQSQSILSCNNEIESLVKSMNRISELAGSVAQNTNETNARLTTGGQEMDSLVTAMNDIVTCFDGIATFVTEINEIAEQTNLLALNASIEAARAGEAGKGFAVVAGEIQSLSVSSAKASENINDMIEKSRVAVDSGKKLLEKTKDTISAGIEYSKSSTKNVHLIVDAVSAQKDSVKEISDNFKEISHTVETNAATAQENSAIAIQLGDCAKLLSDTVNEFKLS